jgi:RHH-type transcriptional regulator, proline utilization regulon repressor / proline dehydrogenase / delta 1-pyrroline-5-carboxylate dehydrogenase
MASGASGEGTIRKQFQEWLAETRFDPSSKHPREAQLAAALARELMRRASSLQTPQERRQQAELDRMIQHPQDRITLTQMTDQAFRSQRPYRAVDQLVHILDAQGIPRFFAPMDRLLLKGFQSFGSYLPGVAVPLVREKMHQETANVILPAEEELLSAHLRGRRAEGVRMNVNFLGEALLGEGDAERRLQSYLKALQTPDIEVLSVKISTIYSQISALARKHTVAVLADRLELLFRAAAKSTFLRSDGRVVPKFVYLDMEEYRDMSLTAEAFMRTLDRPKLRGISAGIVLQAYIPDSFLMQERLTAWARQRVADGGAPITLRVVKGANMEMERFEASLHGWPQAPYKEKLDTDANYRRMVRYGMQPENLKAVRLGIASHNLFEVAYGLILANQVQAGEAIQFEMLEGMANHQRRALFDFASNLLLYAPACRHEDFVYAIGYLVRRLDENTGPDNFLRHAFRIQVDSDDWRRLESQFLEGFRRMDSVPSQPRRTQDRHLVATSPMQPQTRWQEFINEPNTDFSLITNGLWAEELLAQWELRHGANAWDIPLEVAGVKIDGKRDLRENMDPSRPDRIVARYRQANAEDIEQAVSCASKDPSGWRTLAEEHRQAILLKVAQEIRSARGDLMGIALAEGGKLLTESDPEVSEAIDFVEFYSRSATYFRTLAGTRASPRGVVVVVSPWNFPIAIPCGGIAAALAAGNTVILKPASHTVLTAYRLCECFWQGGVSKQALQFLPCAGGQEGKQLVTHGSVDTVILTGGTETALAMLSKGPRMRLIAETGGKNATIVTGMSDRDQAIKNVLYSAFGHSGQKCSATSLLILEDEVFDDENFKGTLIDAVNSMQVGSAWDLKTKMGPLIRPPSGVLERSIKELEPGESWAVMPFQDEANPHVVGPGVKWNVQPASFTHLTEFFGPVLGVMRARDIHMAVELTNQTGFGLTSGLESLDDREQEVWKQGVRAGNLYVNRGTTGAVVLRQPFGGMGKSAFGPGIKAGGPNYVAQLMHFEDVGAPLQSASLRDPQLMELQRHLAGEADRGSVPMKSEDVQRLLVALASYEYWAAEEFMQMHDHFMLVGQDNFRRYLPVPELRIRMDPADTPFELLARVSAAKTLGCRITVSSSAGITSPIIEWLDAETESWAGAIEFVVESDGDVARSLQEGRSLRVRYAHPSRVPLVVRRAAAESGVYVADSPVLAQGRMELLWYVEEQSISDNYHRYGNLGKRTEETRAAIL